jgi:hypothetical protein
MSILTRIRTGLSEYEWEKYWAQVVATPHGQIGALSLGLEGWRSAVVDEGRNRQFIERALHGKKISLRAGVLQVIKEVLTEPIAA